MMIGKRYLGDGVYVTVEDGMIKLTTEDGLRATNTVYLEAEVYDALVRFVDDLQQEAENPRQKGDDDGVEYADPADEQARRRGGA